MCDVRASRGEEAGRGGDVSSRERVAAFAMRPGAVAVGRDAPASLTADCQFRASGAATR
jgi:hypothetical protein